MVYVSFLLPSYFSGLWVYFSYFSGLWVCWSVQGQSPYLDCFFCSHGQRYSALCAVNSKGCIPVTCEVVFRENVENDLDETRGIIYLPPYLPDLNPIELMFGVYKLALKK